MELPKCTQKDSCWKLICRSQRGSPLSWPAISGKFIEFKVKLCKRLTFTKPLGHLLSDDIEYPLGHVAAPP